MKMRNKEMNRDKINIKIYLTSWKQLLKKFQVRKTDFKPSIKPKAQVCLIDLKNTKRKNRKNWNKKESFNNKKSNTLIIFRYHGLKSKPDINAKSRKMAEETSYKPIY